MSTKDGGQAFPQPVALNSEGHEHIAYPGITVRDYFAGKELTKHQGGLMVCDIPEAYARLADHCYRMADAMLVAREGGAA